MGKSYISPSGTAKELLKIYFGNSNNLAQHIDKGYIGDQNGIARLIFGENVPPLPSGYTNLPYLESDGTKWLNTRFIPNNNTRVRIEAEFPDGGTSNQFLYGSRSSTGGSDSIACVYIQNSGCRFDFGSSQITQGSAMTGKITVDQNKNILKIKGSSTITITNTAATINGTYPIYLFACNTAKTASAKSACKIYSCKIWDNGTLVRYMIPCKQTAMNLPGMYDFVNNVFYPISLHVYISGTIHPNATVASVDNANHTNYSTYLQGRVYTGTEATYGLFRISYCNTDKIFKNMYVNFDVTYGSSTYYTHQIYLVEQSAISGTTDKNIIYQKNVSSKTNTTLNAHYALGSNTALKHEVVRLNGAVSQANNKLCATMKLYQYTLY